MKIRPLLITLLLIAAAMSSPLTAQTMTAPATTAPAATPAKPKPAPPAPTIPASSHLVVGDKIIAQPDLTEPLGKQWSTARGIWTPAQGVLTAAQIPAQKHPAVLRLTTNASPMIITCEFRLNKGKSLIVGCNGAKGHVGRVSITPTKWMVAQNSPNPLTGKATNQALSQETVALKPNEWQTLRVEYAGDKIAAWLNKTSLEGEHPFLATPKTMWFFAATDGVQFRKIRVVQGDPVK